MTTAVSRGEIEALRAEARERAGVPLVQRFPVDIRFARELGWIQVRDPFTGEWLEIWGKDAPTGWVRAAFADKHRRQAGFTADRDQADVSRPRPNERPPEEVSYAF